MSKILRMPGGEGKVDARIGRLVFTRVLFGLPEATFVTPGLTN